MELPQNEAPAGKLVNWNRLSVKLIYYLVRKVDKVEWKKPIFCSKFILLLNIAL